MRGPAVGIIGAGTVGTALAVTLSRRGYRVIAVASRSLTSAQRLARLAGSTPYAAIQDVADRAELVFITTPDDAIPKVAVTVGWHEGQGVVHCSGADSVETLEPARRLGASVGCLHPLQTFATVDQAIQNLPGSTFALEGEEPLLGQLKTLAESLGGEWIVLQAGDKVLYHAAAVFACNYLVTLVKLATDLWGNFGVAPDRATRALLPLLRGTLNNIGSVGIPGCLTGPIARGDSGTVRKHLAALEARMPSLLSTYVELGRQTIPVALAKGRIGEHKARELGTLFAQGGEP